VAPILYICLVCTLKDKAVRKTDKIDIFAVGFKGVWRNYPKKNIRKSIRFPFLASLIISGIIYLSEKNVIDFITYLADLITTVIPNILGFTLSGYALIIGLTDTETLQKMSKKDNDTKRPSLFQEVNSTFAFVLMALSSIVIIGLLVKLVIMADIYISFLPSWSASIVNILTFFSLVFLVLYALVSIIDIIKNVFNFGQFVHILNREKNVKGMTK